MAKANGFLLHPCIYNLQIQERICEELIDSFIKGFRELAGCEFQAPQKCLKLIKVYAINFIP
jgi:hypothetical protein